MGRAESPAHPRRDLSTSLHLGVFIGHLGEHVGEFIGSKKKKPQMK